MKRLIVCCDGTWQQLRSPYPTNVVKLAQAIQTRGEDGISQIVFYDEGLGTGDWRHRPDYRPKNLALHQAHLDQGVSLNTAEKALA